MNQLHSVEVNPRLRISRGSIPGLTAHAKQPLNQVESQSMDLMSSTCSRTCLNVCLQTRVILRHTMSYFCLMIVIRLWPACLPKATTCHRSRHVPSVPNGTCRTFCANFESCNLSSRHIFCGMQGMKPPNQQQTNAKNMASCTSDPTCT